MIKDVVIEESIELPVSAFWGFEVAIEDVTTLAECVDPVFPLPGVKKAEIIGRNVLAKGTIRRVYLTNGGVLNEEIVEFQKPSLMKYKQLSGFPFPISLITTSANGEYRLIEENKTTIFTWRACLKPRSVFTRPLLVLIANLFARKLQRNYLENIAKILQN